MLKEEGVKLSKVKLYKMTSDVLCYNKTKELIAETNCKFKSPIDIESPTIRIKIDSNSLISYEKCNYLEIPKFNRFYFVTKIVGICDDIIEISCESDVLSSNDITTITALVERQEFKRNTQIIDNELILQSNNNLIVKTVGNPVITDYSIYITTCGGAK